MGLSYTRTKTTTKAEDIPEGKHHSRIADISEKEIMVDEQVWDNEAKKKVKTGRQVPKVFQEWTYRILDSNKEPAPEVTDLYNISWYTDPVSGMESKLYKSTKKLGILPEIGEDFAVDDAIGREVEIMIVHKEGWPKVQGPIIRALDGGHQTKIGEARQK